MANFNVTIAGGRTSPLIKPESNYLGSAMRYTVIYSDIAVASATGATDTITMALGTTPTNWCVNRGFAQVTTAFAGTTAMTMIVGTTSATAAFVASTSILTAGLIQAATVGINGVAVSTSCTGTSSVTMQAVFTNATGGSPSALTAGQLFIVLNIIDLDRFY